MVYPKNCLIIDIGNDQIKIADLKRNKDNVKVNQFAIIATPVNCINDGIILDKVTLNNTIKAVLKEERFKNKRVVFTITSSKIITREVDFPNLKPKKLRPIVENNAAEYFPVNLSEYILDYVVTDTVEVDGEKSLKVSIIAALTGLVQEYVDLADLMDLKLVGIDYAGNSLTNFIKKEKLKGSSMILDMGSESTMVSVTVDDVLKFNRNLSFGTGLLLDCIMNHFEVNQSEAIRISKERPLLNIEQDENPYLSNDVSSSMNQILNGVARLVDYYTSRNQDKIQTIYIVGGGANIYGIEEYIEKFFGIPTKRISDFKSAKGNHNFNNVELFFSNVIGSAFSEINLVPKTIAQGVQSQSRKRTSLLLVVLVAVSLVAAFALLQGKNIGLERRKAQLEKDIAEAQEVQLIKTDFEKITKRVEFREKILEVSKSTSEYFVAVLETMEQEMPSDVFYLAMSDTGTSIEINCIAKDKLTVAKFIETLKGMGFKDVYVPNITQTNTEDESKNFVSFSVSCKY
ncbi:MAG: hypothetical protein CVU84_00190 [Firmicutes bacterium HGW-Firmicutes-1]|jgi:type IV pilus assembly protein PilM|nr:MAG: hypothetical protein CVU84_00190 [Firmicutes bacterium HGW-Firmicutes-1]